MDSLYVLPYGGITVLVVLLVIFELKEGRLGTNTVRACGYEFFASDGSRVRINKAFGSLYKVYTFDWCPVPTKQDRFGRYFTIRARSASEAEYIVDGLYQEGGMGAP